MVYRPDSVAKRLEKLREYQGDLAQWRDLSLDEYLADRNTRYAVERLLHLTAEAALDILDHLLSAKQEIVSDTYEDVLSNAHRGGFLTEERYRELRGLGGFRNVLAHEYVGIDDATVYRQMGKMNQVLPKLLGDFETLLAPPPDSQG
ncbi:MAG: DUF86 domain-containing protein [Spirochaetaceae bacterium]|nr:DUF86 domain-containing protein [Spirochaetaceae bacterium]MDE0447868.1 DUF86 domain-containing protein [Spirochaetaceae bacterium]